MRIIIEGPDNVGKSTLIKGLIKQLKIPFTILHAYAPPFEESKLNKEFETGLFKEQFKILENFENVICDRSHLGCLVYCDLYNRGYKGDFVLDLEKSQLNQKYWDDVYLIVLNDEPEKLVEREDGLSIQTGLDIKKRESALFFDVYSKSLIKNKIYLNVSNYDIERLKKFVYTWLSEKQNTKTNQIEKN